MCDCRPGFWGFRSDQFNHRSWIELKQQKFCFCKLGKYQLLLKCSNLGKGSRQTMGGEPIGRPVSRSRQYWSAKIGIYIKTGMQDMGAKTRGFKKRYFHTYQKSGAPGQAYETHRTWPEPTGQTWQDPGWELSRAGAPQTGGDCFNFQDLRLEPMEVMLVFLENVLITETYFFS